MTILFNEKSLNDDIQSKEQLFEQIKHVMRARQYLLQKALNIYCKRDFINYRLSNDETIFKYVMGFEKTEKIDVLTWLSKAGPFWDDEQLHSLEDLYVHDKEEVTGTALAEAAAQLFCDEECEIFSLKNEKYLESSIKITWIDNNKHNDFLINNHTTMISLEEKIKQSNKSIESWKRLEELARSEFQNLSFIHECFIPLYKLPFHKAASKSIMEKLNVLNQIKDCFDSSGKFTALGHEIYKNHFTGDKAWFSDSSDGEKIDFANEMTFELIKSDKRLCAWHGKIKTPQLRIHFSFPIEKETPLYIAYIGEKITKK
ncbi:hypothetical protein [Enterobacter mori]|uniref:hypothetical protein n=1 Tax=Enterobacter mori TaxID=539813 RepID=UPI000237CCB0|nr:hypothetical protein [Enterobacter mori]